MQIIAQIFDLTGKGAIVTGGARGIGQAIAFRLAEAGAGVMIADINLEAATQTANEICASGGKAQAVRADVRNATDAKNAVRATIETFSTLDILVNNAGIIQLHSLMEISEEIWDNMLDINLKGAFLCSKAAAAEMIKAGRGGKIINIASIDGIHPNGEAAHYNAAKGGMVMLTKALALELAPHGILVNAVAPGAVQTPGGAASAEAYVAMGKDIRKKYPPERYPLNRYGQPDDIAKVVLFLASAAADYITGDVLVVDGGYLLS